MIDKWTMTVRKWKWLNTSCSFEYRIFADFCLRRCEFLHIYGQVSKIKHVSRRLFNVKPCFLNFFALYASSLGHTIQIYFLPYLN